MLKFLRGLSLTNKIIASLGAMVVGLTFFFTAIPKFDAALPYGIRRYFVHHRKAAVLGPHWSAFNSSRQTLYVANEDSDNLSVVEFGNKAVRKQTIPLLRAPQFVAVSMSTGNVYVTDCYSDSV